MSAAARKGRLLKRKSCPGPGSSRFGAHRLRGRARLPGGGTRTLTVRVTVRCHRRRAGPVAATSYPSASRRTRDRANGQEGSSAKCARLRARPAVPEVRAAGPVPQSAPPPGLSAGASIHSSHARYGRTAARPAPTPSISTTGAGGTRPRRSKRRASSRRARSARSGVLPRERCRTCGRSRSVQPKSSSCWPGRPGAPPAPRRAPRRAGRRSVRLARTPRARRPRSAAPGRRTGGSARSWRRGGAWSAHGRAVHGPHPTAYRGVSRRSVSLVHANEVGAARRISG